MSNNIMTIAIDGPAGSGKGTLANKLAAHYDFACLHTGLLYRALADAVLRQQGSCENIATALELAGQLDWRELNEAHLQKDEIGVCASKLAQHQALRARLVAYQQDFAKHPPQNKSGAILEGRDIGTVILPNAQVKIYLTASLEARTKRRAAQLGARADEIAQDIENRDKRDKNRTISPLIQAEDAHLLDSTKLGINETFNHALEIIELARQKVAGGS